MRMARTFARGGHTLSYLDEGAGAPLLLIHAFPLQSAMWRPQIETLPPGWRALAPDLQGFGRSSRDADAPARHVRDHAADVLALLEAAAPGERAVVAGVSMGGYIAFECWRQRPELIAGLVLADTRADADSDEAQQKRRAMQATAARDGLSAIADAMLPGLLGSSTQTTNPHLASELRALIEGNDPDGVIDALEALRTRPDSRSTLGTIRCPTLVVVGEEDALTPAPLARTIAEGIAGATLVTVPQAGHLASLEHPVAFNDALHRWLAASVPDGSARRSPVE